MEKIEIDRTDEERADLVKSFVRDYWLTAVLVIGGSIAAVAGINYYKRSKIEKRNEMAELAEKTFQIDAKSNLAEAKTALATLQSKNASSGYSTLAGLSLAKSYFERKEYDKASEIYDDIIQNHELAEFRDVAKMRKARVLVDANKPKEALNTLKGIETEEHKVDAAMLSGDIYLAASQFEEAELAYEKGREKADNKRIFEQRLTLVKIKQNTSSSEQKPAQEQGTIANLNSEVKESKSKVSATGNSLSDNSKEPGAEYKAENKAKEHATMPTSSKAEDVVKP